MRKGIQRVFSEVSETYELVNHVLTLGQDRRWRRRAARRSAQARAGSWLDVCSGTGEMAQNLAALGREQTIIVSLDFSARMLARAAEKAPKGRIHLVMAEASRLPFAEGTFDLITISFASRNINLSKTILTEHFREFRRVLKPGGLFINLETSQPRLRAIRSLFHLYIKLAVKPVGYFISGSRAGYTYLSQTIPRFYDSEALAQILLEAGFRRVDYERLFFGVVAIHTAIK